MSSLITESGIYTIPDGSRIGSKTDTIDIPNAIFTNATFTNLIVTGSAVTPVGPVTTSEITEASPGEGVSINGAIKFLTESLQTGNTTPASLFVIPATTSTAYYYSYDIIGTTASTIAVFKGSFRAKSIAGTVTVGSLHDSWEDPEAGLESTTVSVTSSGSNVIIRVQGISGIMNWIGCVKEISMQISMLV